MDQCGQSGASLSLIDINLELVGHVLSHLGWFDLGSAIASSCSFLQEVRCAVPANHDICYDYASAWCQAMTRWQHRLTRLDDVATRPRGIATEGISRGGSFDLCGSRCSVKGWINGKISVLSLASIASCCPNLKYLVFSDAQVQCE